MSTSLEHLFQIWDDDHGFRYEVGGDSDGLDLVEVRYYEGAERKAHSRMTFTREQAELVVKAITQYLEETCPKNSPT